jgi:hypothetical protein
MLRLSSMVAFTKLLQEQHGMKTEAFWDVTRHSLIGTDVSSKPDISIFKAGDRGEQVPQKRWY